MIDLLCQGIWFEKWKSSQFHSEISEWEYSGEKIMLMKPLTFMNLSWDAVSLLMHFYKLDPKSDLLVISDDIDMEFTKVRYRSQWSHGGQNWLRDIMAKLGTDEFSRIKIGIGRDARYDIADWVLSKLTAGEIQILEDEVYPNVEAKISEYLHI